MWRRVAQLFKLLVKPIVPIRIIALGLADGIEDPAGLPTIGVIAQIPVHEILRDTALASSIINQEVGSQVAGNIYSQTVVPNILVNEAAPIFAGTYME
jgi:hypothetical protein